MKAKCIITSMLVLFVASFLKAQSITTDSAKVVNTLQQLLTICKTVDFTDPKVSSIGMFYKAAPYIIYRGDDKNRAWKDFANYADSLEKTGVDNICYKINGSINQDANYKIEKYFTQKESEGIWYVVQVSYVKKGVVKKAVYAFLKVGDRFGLGDID